MGDCLCQEQQFDCKSNNENVIERGIKQKREELTKPSYCFGGQVSGRGWCLNHSRKQNHPGEIENASHTYLRKKTIP